VPASREGVARGGGEPRGGARRRLVVALVGCGPRRRRRASGSRACFEVSGATLHGPWGFDENLGWADSQSVQPRGAGLQ
jgi:hypothetical protein